AEAALAARHDLQYAKLRHVPFGDARQRADLERHRGLADLAAFADQADAERRAVLEAGLRHRHVALLKDAQRQVPAREQHRVEREERQIVYFASSEARCRCLTSTFHFAVNAAARRSARYTERCRPPVQPMATVTELRFSRTISGSQRSSRPCTSASQRPTAGSASR